MILLVTGGRTFCEAIDGKSREDYMAERVALGFALDTIAPSSVIVGDADGADRWARIWCERRSVACHVEKADWSNGPRGGPERNQRMVDMNPDAAVRLPGGRGTDDCAGRCERANIPVYEVKMSEPKPAVFVFGSNIAGRHGAGAALFAKQNHGAIYGQGEGRQGNSYGIPTKENDPDDPRKLITIPLDRISAHVARFIEYAQQNPTTYFQLTRIGCGLAGYRWADQVGPMFADIPSNVILPSDTQ